MQRPRSRSSVLMAARATVLVHASVVPHGEGSLYDRHITLVLKKEPARHMLVAPVKVWRVVNHGEPRTELRHVS